MGSSILKYKQNDNLSFFGSKFIGWCILNLNLNLNLILLWILLTKIIRKYSRKDFNLLNIKVYTVPMWTFGSTIAFVWYTCMRLVIISKIPLYLTSYSETVAEDFIFYSNHVSCVSWASFNRFFLFSEKHFFFIFNKCLICSSHDYRYDHDHNRIYHHF